MRFSGEHDVQRPVDVVWAALHHREVLRQTIPGCQELVPLGDGRYAATLGARVGPIADTYRGSFSIEDRHPGSDLRVVVDGRGRCGRLELDLQVSLRQGWTGGWTTLAYVADASVRGIVGRLGSPALNVAGGQLTACFFRQLNRALHAGVTGSPQAAVR